MWGSKIRSQYPGLSTHKEKVEKLTEVMDQLGYNTRNASVSGGESIIEADKLRLSFHRQKESYSFHLDRGLMEPSPMGVLSITNAWPRERGLRLPFQTQTQRRIGILDQPFADCKAESLSYPFQRGAVQSFHQMLRFQFIRKCNGGVSVAPTFQLLSRLQYSVQRCDN